MKAEELGELYATVRHESGRIDFEPLAYHLRKNQVDLLAGLPIKRAALGLWRSTRAAQEQAAELKAALKEQRDESQGPGSGQRGSDAGAHGSGPAHGAAGPGARPAAFGGHVSGGADGQHGEVVQ